MASQCRRFSVNSVAIVGGGPSGIAAAKYLLAENHYSKIKIFEQRATAGGIWNYSDSGNTNAQEDSGGGNCSDSTLIPSPMYDGLESNIPLSIMQYSDVSFPNNTPLLPDWQTILQYLKDYARDTEHMTVFQRKVVDVRPDPEDGLERWILTSLDIGTKHEEQEVFDAVIVANGRYNDPYVPEIPGLNAWRAAYPTAISHSKFYRNSTPFKDKKVVIVGYSSSGEDIGDRIESVCSSPLLVSLKSTNKTAQLAGKQLVSEIAEFLVEDRAIRFSDGRLETNVDHVVFCTGYSYSYPFLSSLPAFSDGFGNQDAWQHIFYIPRPTLAFVLLPLRVNAFPFSESQSALIARIWSNRLILPDKRRMEEWMTRRVAERGSGKSFHKFGYPADADYMDEMLGLCMQATRKEGLVNSGLGKLPPNWGEKERWTRQRIHELRKAVQDKGEDRHEVKTLEHIGFDFEEWKKKKATPALRPMG
ncbi:MAG: hypothetical protein Q9207_006709 [Kuettlingeria erythrocarpa]